MRESAATIDFKCPICDIIKEVAIMSNQNNCACIFDQVILEPCHRLSIQMVGRFIHQQ